MNLSPPTGLVPATRVGFGTHPGNAAPSNPSPLPTYIVDSFPAGPLRYRTGDPLALLTVTTNGVDRTIEALTSGRSQDDLVEAERGGDALSLRDTLKVAFNRAHDHDAQAILQAQDGTYWIAQLSGVDSKPIRIDGPDSIKVSGAARGIADLVAIIGKDQVINLSKQDVRKPRWWDPILR